jgi:hypothetical protein
MEILYRKFNATDGYTTIEHNNLDRSKLKGLFKLSISNPRMPISALIKSLEEPHTISNKIQTNLNAQDEVKTEGDPVEEAPKSCSVDISSNLLNKAQVGKYLQDSRDTLKSLGHEDMYPDNLFSNLNFEEELDSNCTNEWLIGNQNYYLYYIITSNASWLPFLKKEVLYTVVYGIKVVPEDSK